MTLNFSFTKKKKKHNCAWKLMREDAKYNPFV